MTKSEATTLARGLMSKHGFAHLELTFSNTKNALGRCFFRSEVPTRIDLSSYWLSHLSEEQITETILHELAHAKAGVRAGHNYIWKSAARKLGANPNRVAELPTELTEKVLSENAKYKASCTKCDTTVYFHRLTRKWQMGQYVCGKCRGKLVVMMN